MTTLKAKDKKEVTKQWKPKSTREVEDLQIRAACCKYPFDNTQFSFLISLHTPRILLICNLVSWVDQEGALCRSLDRCIYHCKLITLHVDSQISLQRVWLVRLSPLVPDYPWRHTKTRLSALAEVREVILHESLLNYQAGCTTHVQNKGERHFSSRVSGVYRA